MGSGRVLTHNLLSIVLYGFAGFISLLALVLPFVIRSYGSVAGQGQISSINETPLIATLLTTLCLAVLLVEMQGQTASAKTVAALGLMVAATATLRFIEVAIPGPAGFSPIFAPIILGGYVFGPRFGFLLGAMTLFVSAIITAGVGPWLPYQMITAGWVGLSAGWLPHWRRPSAEIIQLLVFAFLWGFFYGLIMNLYSWPYLVGNATTTWSPDAGVSDSLRRYVAYYLATSLLWDSAAAIGNVILMAVLGLPAVRALARFRGRMQFQVVHP